MGMIRQSVRIDNRRVDAVVDSGASNSIIKMSIARQLGLPAYKRATVTLPDGRTLAGFTTVALIYIWRRNLSIKLVAADIKDDLIIGADFLQERYVVIDYRKHKLKFNYPWSRVIRV